MAGTIVLAMLLGWLACTLVMSIGASLAARQAETMRVRGSGTRPARRPADVSDSALASHPVRR